jgi:hypothetical protein
MSTEKTSIPLDRVSFTLSLAGVLLGIAVAMVGCIYEQNFTTYGYGVFVAFSIAAIVLGAITRSSVIGKTALVTPSILRFGSIGMPG